MRSPLKRLLCLLLGILLATIVSSGVSHSSALSLVTEPHSPLRRPSVVEAQPPNFLEQGRAAYSDQRFTDAVAAWLQADRLQDPLDQALVLSYLSAAYQQLGQWDAAQSALDQSQNLLPDQLSSLKVRQVSAQVYNTLGSLHFSLGKTQQALETWQIAADLYVQAKEDSRYFNNLLNQIQAQQTLGYYHQVRETVARLEQRLPTQSATTQIQGYQRLGQVYRLTGDLTKAQASLQTALELTSAADLPTGPVLLELGNVAQAEEDLPKALALYQEVVGQEASGLNIRIKAQLNQLKLLVNTDPITITPLVASLATDIADMNPGRSQIYAYINAAQSLFQLGSATEINTATSWLAQAIQASIDLQDSRAESYARGYLGRAYELSQQWSKAQELTEEALMIAQSINAADITYQWQWQLGRLLKQQNQRELALQAYREAYATLQLLRQDIVTTSQDLQFSFRDSVEPVYRELVDLLLRPGSNEIVQLPARVTIQNSLKPVQNSLTQSEQKQTRLLEAREVIESLQVAELDNFFRTACLEAQQVDLDEVEQTSAAVIYPIILADRLEMVVSLPGQPLTQYTTPVTQAKLEQTIVDWRQNLEKAFTTPEGRALGQDLYQWLIEPMQPALSEADVQTLVFVLDGTLRNVPMAALYNGKHYLIEQYAVVLSPGLQLLGPRSLKETSGKALLAGLTESRYGYSPLLNVADELETVQKLVNSSLLLNETFTTEQLTEQVTQSGQAIIHLATHGQFGSTAEDTFILAWDRPIPVNELSALLKVGDTSRVDPIELLVLSACETASGDSQAALGLAGVALQSGTRSTLASLWNIDDASSAAFAQSFYQTITRPQSTKAEALRAAQLALLNDPNYRHPVHWAAYVLVGSWL